MESNMKGFKFYEKHCGKTIAIFLMCFLYIYFMHSITITQDRATRSLEYHEKCIEELQEQINSIKSKSIR